MMYEQKYFILLVVIGVDPSIACRRDRFVLCANMSVMVDIKKVVVGFSGRKNYCSFINLMSA